ncbi:MAG TPA: fumarylacetoacetate hydrolase family protein [Acidimicrobiia bacterium]|nr:fumarylacetoacetate hydrolase family protein [Acidimicrobiia bacterium]
MSFRKGDAIHIGLVVDGTVVDVTALRPDLSDMVDVIAVGPGVLTEIANQAESAPKVGLMEVRLQAPLRPRKNVFAVGRNYLEHVREVPGPDAATRPPPDQPIIFTKPPTSIIGPGEAIDTRNDPTGTTDYEGELAVVIGKVGKRLSPEEAWDHVFGYTIVNDVTARAMQRRHAQWVMGKGPDTFCPMGPWIVTSDEIADVTRLEVRTTVNGEPRQRGSLADLIFDIPTLIATLSSVLTLEPGDVIATGTPSGVGAGFDPPRFLRAGDEVSVTIDHIGTLTNPVI